MAKYRKKPVTIDAVLWTGKNHREMFDLLTNSMFHDVPMTISGKNFYIDHEKVEGGLVIKTLEGEHIASIGDFIIKGVNGEFYPCKPDIFFKTYEIVEDNEKETIGNRIRKMSDEELAEFILKTCDNPMYETGDYICEHCIGWDKDDHRCNDENCKQAIEKWLKEENND